MAPTLTQVATAILDICPGSIETFKPSALRIRLSRVIVDAHPDAASLNAQIQPFLKLLREKNVIMKITANQIRNVPWRVINRRLLQEIATNPNFIFDDVGNSNFVPADHEDSSIDAIAELEEEVGELGEKLIEAMNRIVNLEAKLENINENLRKSASIFL